MNEDTKSSKAKEKNLPKVVVAKGNNFIADIEVKKLLTTMPTKKLIHLMNSFRIKEINKKAQILFKMQETFEGTGDKNKRFLRSDLTIQATYDDIIRDVGVEIETSKSGKIPFRKFMYNLNNSRLEKGIRIVADGILIYATIHLKRKNGSKIFKIQIPNSQNVSMNSSEFMDNLINVRYNYINILQMDFEEFKGQPWEILKVIYLYRYKQDITLISKEKERFINILEELKKYIETLNSRQKEVSRNIFYNLMSDIEYKCYKYKKYEKEAKIMQTIRLTAADMFRMELIETVKVEKKKAKKEARAEGRMEGLLEGKIQMLLSLKYSKEKILEMVEITEEKFEEIIDKRSV